MTNVSAPARLAVRLQSIRFAAKDTHLFEFIRLDGMSFPAVDPGAHVDLHLPNGLTRSYSLVSFGQDLYSLTVGIKLDRNSRGGSRFIHRDLRVGDTLHLSGPRNHFPMLDGDHPTVLIAGGIGITPIWAMVQKLFAKGATTWQLWYSARCREEMAFCDALTEMAQKLRGEIHLHFDDEQGGPMDLTAIFRSAPKGAHFYCCGPGPMLAAYEQAAKELGVPEQSVHLERFAPAQAASVDGGYQVVLVRSDLEFMVEQGTSLLSALEQRGIAVDSSCREGLCGCCEVTVLEGEVDHRDSFLTESERASNRSMLVCCSGSKSSRLVLDL